MSITICENIAMRYEISVEEALAIINAEIKSLPGEIVALETAYSRVLAQNCVTQIDLPFYTTAAMDGWVVSGESPWQVIGEIKIGEISNTKLEVGQAMQITTGGVIPEGSEAVIPWEIAKLNDKTLTGVITKGANIRPSGAECRAGETIFSHGAWLNSAKIGLLAATGHDEIFVTRKPKVSVICLGNELIHKGLPASGAIRDSLGIHLPSLLESLGADCLSREFSPDEIGKVLSAFESGVEKSDLIITTGGTADSNSDLVYSMLDHFKAEYLFNRVKVRPSYHILLSKIKFEDREVLILSLPGNPQSALAAFTLFGIPVLSRMLAANKPKTEQIFLSESISTPKDFYRLVPGVIDSMKFKPAEHIGSAMLRGLANSSGFALVPPGSHAIGAEVTWLPFPSSNYGW